MNLYSFIRSLLFLMDPEKIGNLTLKTLNILGKYQLLPQEKSQDEGITLMGLDFPNRVGLSAGLDKNGIAIQALSKLGFGFIEIGTITPRPQQGNPLPRIFRLKENHAIINRMGFPNVGIDQAIENIKNSQYKGILGINLGKNADTPIEKAADDYRIGMQKAYPFASYLVINISSPNTEGLRSLQFDQPLQELIQQLKQEQERLSQKHGKRTPLLLKISPDLSKQELQNIANICKQYHIDGIIATNTTIQRDFSQFKQKDKQLICTRHKSWHEKGGLSGQPLTTPSTMIISQLAKHLAGELPIIGVGGIMNDRDAVDKMQAGASLIQLYTGLIYQGPSLIKECKKAIIKVRPMPHNAFLIRK